jgi:hypothetical protein
MHKKYLVALACLLSLVAVNAQDKGKVSPAAISTTPDTAKPKKPAGITDKVKSSRKMEGLFTAYQDTANGSVQLYIKKDQLGKEFIYQSFSLNGPNSLYLNQGMHRSNFIFRIEKSYDRLEFSRIITSFWYDPQNPMSRTKDVDKPDAILQSERIAGEDADGYLVNADGLFISEKLDPVKPVSAPGFFMGAGFSLGMLNPGKSKFDQIKSFPGNTDFVVDLAYDNPNAFVSGGADITDARYVRVRLQHSFIQMPENHFTPRRDDPRVGFFTQWVTDQTSINPVPYRDMINRWNLVKKDPSAAISEPVEPIVFWIENTTPVEYRQTILEAGLKWNKAFEAAGFTNAIQMKIMPDDAGWDPSDIRYNVIRWVSSASPSYGAIAQSIVNPATGQILGSDISVEWFSGSAMPIYDELVNGKQAAPSLNLPGMDMTRYGMCTLGSELKNQFSTGTTVLDVGGAGAKELSEMHRQYLTYLIMHEMGHTLGLNHNMKGSQMWSPSEINNKELTDKFGLTGSVMDYPAINIASDRKKQGDYYTTIAGPYDDWAIQYGYSVFAAGEEEAGLKKVLSRSNDPKLAFGNDGDDMRTPGKAMDPRVNINDLTNDAIAYAEDRFKLVNSLMGKLIGKYSKDGQSYAELRARYGTLQAQRFNMIATVSRYIGGVYIDRSFPEQHSGTRPFTPVPVATQKKAMQVLSKYVFAPDAFQADAPVFAYLQPQRRGFNQSGTGDDYRITGNVLNQQINGAISHLLHPATMQRMTNSRLYGNKYSVADMLNDLNQALFAADLKINVNVYRQYLQSQYVKVLLGIVEDKFGQYDDVSEAAALNAVKKLRSLEASGISTNEETKAHRANIIYLINRTLDNK